MNKESTLYDYTKSAEELRQFELREKCSKIAMEYERFNLENDVYKMFGEWLLNEAKTKYSVVFTSKDLIGFLNSRRVVAPDSVTIAAKKEDYASCENLRMLSIGYYWSYKSGYDAEYTWYTLWKITKAYNKKNGCIVINAPRHEDGCVKIDLDWSKDAQDCITRERWRKDAKSSFVMLYLEGIAGFGGGFILWGGLWLILKTFVPTLCDTFLFGQPYIGTFLIGLSFVLFCEFYLTNRQVDKCAVDFDAHCKNIQNTRGSTYSIERDRVTY